ncbi:MAG: hypothetical protein NPIRA02_02590 [Nitrospirales bacterium]|nr:MAG: hypothetical protein NPIRA02_02590 [Nitrospirales bacterium]
MFTYHIKDGILIILFATSLITGCAAPIKTTQGEVRDITPSYSRNAAVSVPTAVGNVAGGLVGVGLGVAVALPAMLSGHPEIIRDVFLGSILIGGGAVGSPFIPLSKFFPEDRWEEESTRSMAD